MAIPTFRTLAFWVFVFFAVEVCLTYTVKDGDTLWDISRQKLADPFRWTDIWKANPTIQNPDLIYPRDEITLPGSADFKENSQAPSSKPRVNFAEEMKGFSRAGSEDAGPIITGEGKNNAQPHPTRQELKGDLQIKAPFLQGQNSDAKFFPQESKIHFPPEKKGELLTVMEEFEVRSENGSGFTKGDIFEVFTPGPKVKNSRQEKMGNALFITGIARVEEILSGKTRFKLIQCYGPVSKISRLRPLENLPPLRVAAYEKATTETPGGSIIYLASDQKIIHPHTYLIIDVNGSSEFSLGDAVAFRDNPGKKSAPGDDVLGSGLVVRTGPGYVAVYVHDVFPGPLGLGDFAQLSHKARLTP